MSLPLRVAQELDASSQVRLLATALLAVAEVLPDRIQAVREHYPFYLPIESAVQTEAIGIDRNTAVQLREDWGQPVAKLRVGEALALHVAPVRDRAIRKGREIVDTSWPADEAAIPQDELERGVIAAALEHAKGVVVDKLFEDGFGRSEEERKPLITDAYRLMERLFDAAELVHYGRDVCITHPPAPEAPLSL